MLDVLRTRPPGRPAWMAARHPTLGRASAALGHEVRLIPPAYVRPYVTRQKNDAADAEAICAAVARPNMHFVPIRSPEPQSVPMRRRARDRLRRQRCG